MKDSLTYQMIVQEAEQRGEIRGERKGELNLLLKQCKRKFGDPTESQLSKLLSITDDAQIVILGERVLFVNSWEEFFNSSE